MDRKPVIVNIRGTSGAGKTTLVRAITSQYTLSKKFVVPGRKQPLLYIYRREGHRPLVVLGHYESACGGCDTISKYIPDLTVTDGEERTVLLPNVPDGNSYDTTFGLIKAYNEFGFDVLFEGLLLSGDYSRTAALHTTGLNVAVVALSLPVEQCIASVIERRKAKGNTEPFNEKNTREKHTLLQKCLGKFGHIGLPVFSFAEREDARLQVELLLGLAERVPVTEGVTTVARPGAVDDHLMSA